jgi:hypothetical protein
MKLFSYAEACDGSTPRGSNPKLHGDPADTGGVHTAMVDACDLGAMGARRQEPIEALSGGIFISIFEEKYREALVQLSIEELYDRLLKDEPK